MRLVLIITILTLFCSFTVKANTYCSDQKGKPLISNYDFCPPNYKEISKATYCYRVYDNSEEYLNHCTVKAVRNEAIDPKASDEKLCSSIVNKNGSINYEFELGIIEAEKRGLTVSDCKILTDRFTSEEKAYIQEQVALLEKKERIKDLKSDCDDMGFKEGTEAMGNCVLKLMELEGKNTNQSNVVSTTDNQGLTEYEKRKLEIEEGYLRAEQERIRLQEKKNREEIRQRAAENLFNWGQELANPKRSTSTIICNEGRGWNAKNTTCTAY